MTWRLLAAVLVMGVQGCSSGGGPVERAALEPTPSVGTSAPAGASAERVTGDLPSLLPTPRFVTHLGPAKRSCPDPFATECVEGYRTLAEILRPDLKDWKVRDTATLGALRSLAEGGSSSVSASPWAADWADVPESLTGPELVGELLRRLGLVALLEAPEVLVTLDEGTGGVARGVGEDRQYRHLELSLRHPRLGDFDAAVRLPQADGPVPLILVLPGHISGNGFVEDTWAGLAGERMVAEGFGLVIARPRGTDAEAVETAAAARLISAGHSLLGAHTAEAWLLATAVAHLRGEGHLPPGKTGLLGHSSGALVGNVLCHINGAVKSAAIEACVNDLWSDYFKLLCDGDRCWVLDETDPRLRGMRQPLSSTSSLPTLTPRPSYGLVAEDGSDREIERVLTFFKARLR